MIFLVGDLGLEDIVLIVLIVVTILMLMLILMVPPDQDALEHQVHHPTGRAVPESTDNSVAPIDPLVPSENVDTLF